MKRFQSKVFLLSLLCSTSLTLKLASEDVNETADSSESIPVEDSSETMDNSTQALTLQRASQTPPPLKCPTILQSHWNYCCKRQTSDAPCANSCTNYFESVTAAEQTNCKNEGGILCGASFSGQPACGV
mmetsp:Transcript_14978/g.26235  ORF Transcript_14978/g.26235 Transcript_14978/m.26235 type:complete len:129 (-) Transcript_14978:64-450(-)